MGEMGDQQMMKREVWMQKDLLKAEEHLQEEEHSQEEERSKEEERIKEEAPRLVRDKIDFRDQTAKMRRKGKVDGRSSPMAISFGKERRSMS